MLHTHVRSKYQKVWQNALSKPNGALPQVTRLVGYLLDALIPIFWIEGYVPGGFAASSHDETPWTFSLRIGEESAESDVAPS